MKSLFLFDLIKSKRTYMNKRTDAFKPSAFNCDSFSKKKMSYDKCQPKNDGGERKIITEEKNQFKCLQLSIVNILKKHSSKTTTKIVTKNPHISKL